MSNMERIIEQAARTLFLSDRGDTLPVGFAERQWDEGHAVKDDYIRRARALAEAGYLTAAITRDDIDRALINVTSNAMNYPTPSQMLGKDSGPLRKKCVDAVCELFGIEDR